MFGKTGTSPLQVSWSRSVHDRPQAGFGRTATRGPLLSIRSGEFVSRLMTTNICVLVIATASLLLLLHLLLPLLLRKTTTTIITSAAATTAAPLLCCHSQSQVCLFAYITCYSCVQTQNQTSTCCTCMCVYVYCTYTYTYAYTCMYVCMYVIIHASMHTYRLRHLRIPARKGRGRDEACGRHDCRFIHRCRRSIISALIL